MTLDSANTYFTDANHVQAAVWAAFSLDQKTAAIAQATRVLRRWNDDEALDDDVTADGDFPRPDLAVYEQALWILINSRAVPNGDVNGPKFMDETRGDPGAVAPEARRWLVKHPGQVVLCRG